MVISLGDTVLTDYHPACVGCVFVVTRITPYGYCESGHMVLVHLKDEPERTLQGKLGLGLDTNWFKLHDADNATGQD